MKKKHELLKYAYDNYPKGAVCRFKNINVDHISDGTFKVIDSTDNGTCVVNDSDNQCFYSSDTNEWAEIIEEPKSILDGKVAIQVSNEREFELLMKNYEEKGWKQACTNKKPISVDYFGQKELQYHDEFYTIVEGSSISSFDEENYTIIPFSEFAKEVGIEVPVFIMKSEDGIDLYEGDEHHVITVCLDKSWSYAGYQKLKKSHMVVTKPELAKAFSTREDGEKWIAEQNKPKETEIRLYSAYNSCVVKDKTVNIINTTTGVIELVHSDIEDIHNAIKQLKGGDNA